MTSMMAITTYRIQKSTGFYPELSTLLIALQGVAVAVAYTINGKVSHKPGDYVTIEALHTGWEIRLPLVGPIEAALANRAADEIELTVVTGKTPTILHIFYVGIRRVRGRDLPSFFGHVLRAIPTGPTREIRTGKNRTVASPAPVPFHDETSDARLGMFAPPERRREMKRYAGFVLFEPAETRSAN